MKVVHVTMIILAVLLLGAAGSNEGGGVAVTDVITLLREFGFPIFVVLWFMWRLEKRLDAFTESIQKLLTVVTVMSRAIDELATETPPKAVGPLASGKDVA